MKVGIVASIVAVALAACHREPSGEHKQQDDSPAATSRPGADLPVPSYPWLIEIVHGDGHAEIRLASDLPETMRLVDGKRVFKIVDTGQCIQYEDENGRALKSVYTTPAPPGASRGLGSAQ